MKTTAYSFHDFRPAAASLRSEVIHGLSRPQKSIPPKFFYDERGSRLFDEICRTPEYYPTRTECAILEHYALEIAQIAGPDSLLVEFGSGSSHKIRLLLEALRPAAYMPLDISREHLAASAQAIAKDYPWLHVYAVCVDFSLPTLRLPRCPKRFNKKIAFFPGSSIGNFDPGEALDLLRRMQCLVGPGGGVVIGVDLKKDPALLNRAYNDARGVTAAFNLNLLVRINHELGADFDPGAFRHQAFYNAGRGRIEMHLTSRIEQTVTIGRHQFRFARGESIHTENSYKYDAEEFIALAQKAGFSSQRVWIDPQHWFAVCYLGGLHG